MDGILLGLYEKAMPNELRLEEKLRLTKLCGCDYLELSIDETEEKRRRLDWSDAELGRIRTVCAEADVPIRSLCLSAHRRFALGSRDASVRREALRIAERSVRIADKLGIRLIQLAGYDVYYEQSGADTRAYFLENLSACTSFAARYGVVLAFETMETPFMNTVAKAAKYVGEVNSPYLQIYPDIGNISNATKDVSGDLLIGRGRLAAAHLKETRRGIYRELEYGEGTVDFGSCISVLLRLGVRMFVCEFWHDGVTEPSEYLQRNVAFIRRCFERTK